mgnify:CR=1 FL=1
MAKHTTRDEIWHATLTLVEENAEKSGYAAKFTAADVAERLESAPSSRTVRDTLNTMVDLGHLEEGWGQGNYEPPTAE